MEHSYLNSPELIDLIEEEARRRRLSPAILVEHLIFDACGIPNDQPHLEVEELKARIKDFATGKPLPRQNRL